MDNFNKYTYARTLRFLEAYYPYDNEDVHYANVMLSMNQCKTIDELIAVRERLKEKIKKVSDFLFSDKDKLPKELTEELSKRNVEVPSKNIVRFQLWDEIVQENLGDDVESCYDENIFRLFRECDTITPQTCGEFFINLSCCEEKSKYIVPITNVAKERSNIDVSELLVKIAKRYNDFGEHWKKFKEFKEGMNGYNPAKKVVEDDFAYLKQFNWRLLPNQRTLYSEIDREEQKKREEHAKHLKEQREKKAEEERKHNEDAIRKKRKKMILIIVLGVIVYIVILVLICLYLPPGLENWILAIIVYLAIMKTLFGKL